VSNAACELLRNVIDFKTGQRLFFAARMSSIAARTSRICAVARAIFFADSSFIAWTT
jgi:hypothetical protein